MKRIKQLALCATVMLSAALPLRAQWNQNSGTGPFTYTDPANWVGGIVSNVFSTPPLSGIILQFPSDYVLTNGVMMSFPGSSNVLFQSDSGTARTLHISLGNFQRTNNNGGTITIGSVTNPLILDLYGSTRTIGGGTALSTSSSLITTMNINAQIMDSSGHTNGVNFGGGNIYANLLNTGSSFLGPVTFNSLRGGGFTSIKPVGGGPSSLGAPLDATNGIITVADGGSFGKLSYLGTGDTSDRSFFWNITANHTNMSWGADYSFINAGTGPLKFSGQWTFPTNRTANSEFIIAAYSNSIEMDGYMEGLGNANGTYTSLLFYGGPNGVATNRNILTGLTNTFKDFYVSNSVLAFNNTAPIGTPSAIGAGTNIVLLGGSGGSTTWAGGTGQGSTLQYFGTNTVFSRNLTFAGSFNSFYWGLDNAGTNTSLTWSNTITWNMPGAVLGFTPRYLFINPLPGSTNVVLSQIPDANITEGGLPSGTMVAAANPIGAVVNNGGVVQLLNPANTFAGGVQVAYSRTMQVAALADIGQPSSIGTGLYPGSIGSTPIQLTGITLGSTDSQRGGTLSYIGTTNASSDQLVTIVGSTAALNSGTLRNDSTNNSSLHLTSTGTWNLYSVMPKCLMTLGGSAVATNTLDAILPDVPGQPNSGSLLINGSAWRLTAVQAYSGTTMVANATMVLDGSIASGLGLTVAAGGWLTGTGTVNETVTVNTNGTIAAGDGGIGTLNLTANLTNLGNVYLKLNKSAATNDQLALNGNVMNYGGNLIVTNMAGTLVLNDTFVLFTAGAYVGSFVSSNLPPLNSGLAWDTSGLAANGSIKVVVGGPAAPPVFTTINLSGTNVVLSGTNGTISGNFYVLASTNLATPVLNWATISTNSFNSLGNFTVTNSIVPGAPANFFRIKLP